MPRPFPPHDADKRRPATENGVKSDAPSSSSGPPHPGPSSWADWPVIDEEFHSLRLEDPQLEEYEAEVELREGMLDLEREVRGERLAGDLAGIFGSGEGSSGNLNGRSSMLDSSTVPLNMTELLNDIDDDPLAVLRAAIDQDRPRSEQSPEWEAVLRSISEDPTLGQLVDVPQSTEPEPVSMNPPRQQELTSSQDGATNDDADAVEEPEERSLSLPHQEEVFYEGSEGSEASSSSIPLGVDTEAQIMVSAFEQLRPVCSRLLELREERPALLLKLKELALILRSLSSVDVAPCTSYVLFPLFMLLDMETSPLVEETRTGGGEENNEDDEPGAPGGSNAVLEAVLTCVQCILSHARETSKDGETTTPAEVTPLVASTLPRLTAVLTWPAVSEDACILAIGSLDQLLLVTEQDVNASLQDAVVLSAQSRAFFGGNEGAAHFGHLCSTLLQVAVRQTHLINGDKKLVSEAVRLLAVLVGNKIDADVLGYFLPGLLSGLVRLLSRKGALSPLTIEGTAMALHAISGVICATLGGTNSDQGGGMQESAQAPSVAMALDELRRLASQTAVHHRDDSNGAGLPSHTVTTAEGDDSSTGNLNDQTTRSNQAGKEFAVERNAMWVAETAGKLDEVLGRLLPSLIKHASPKVRLAVVEACRSVYESCSQGALKNSALLEVLTDCLGIAGQDSWPDVAQHAQQGLRLCIWRTHFVETPPPLEGSHNKFSTTGTKENELRVTAFVQEFEGLVPAFQRSSEAGTAQALRLASLLASAPEGWVRANLILDPGTCPTVLNSLLGTFRIDRDVAALASNVQAMKVDVIVMMSSSETVLPSVPLPRQPWAAAYITTPEAWRAMSAVARELGSCGVQFRDAIMGNTPGSSALASLLEPLLAVIAGEVNQLKISLEELLEDDSGGLLAAAQLSLRQASALSCASAILSCLGPDDRLSSSAAALEAKQGEPTSDKGKPEAKVDEIIGLIRSYVNMLSSLAPWQTVSHVSDEEIASENSMSASMLQQALPKALISRGASTVLQRACWDFVAVAAAVLGPRFVQNGAIMRLILLPLLQSLESPSGKLVQESASIALAAFVRHGVTKSTTSISTTAVTHLSLGVAELVAANADYLVDDLCRQLRQPDRYPDAARLFAGLLRQTGVPQTLLPLLAEPVRIALQGLSLYARSNTLSFVEALGEVVGGAATLGASCRSGVVSIADDVQVRWDKAAQDRQRARQLEMGVSDDESEPIDSTEDDDEGEHSDRSISFDTARAYFTKRLERQEARQGHRFHPEGEITVALDEESSDTLRTLRRQMHAAATLASSISDACGVLVQSKSLDVATAALSTCVKALRVLNDTTTALGSIEKRIEVQVVGRNSGEPVPAPMPRLLPSVHLLWEPMMLALADDRDPLVEAALSALGDVTKLAGSFLARRFAKEAWPRLKECLEGKRSVSRASQNRPALVFPGHDVPEAPGATLRLRCAVCLLLQRLADAQEDQAPDALGGGGAQEVVEGVIEDAISAVSSLLDDTGPVHLREAATKAFMSLGSLQPKIAVRLLDRALGNPSRDDREKSSSPDGLDPDLDKKKEPTPVPAGLWRCNTKKLEAMRARLLQES